MSDAQSKEAARIPEWTFGWRLQRALAHGSVKGQEMAENLGVTRGTISRWCNDVGRPPRAAYVKQWALKCRVPYDWLVSGAGHGPTAPAASEVPVSGSRCNVGHATVATIHRLTVAA